MKKLFDKIWEFLVDRFTARQAKEFVVCDKILTRANAVTVFGIILTTFYFYQFWFGFLQCLIPIILPLAFGTDCIDGYLADKDDEHSKWGKIVDVFRDRYITFALLCNIWIVGDHFVWFPVLIIMVLETLMAIEMHIIHRKGVAFSVHAIEKSRSMLHWFAGYLIIIQYYWIGSTFLSQFFLSWVMLFASLAAYFYYTPKYLEHGLRT